MPLRLILALERKLTLRRISPLPQPAKLAVLKPLLDDPLVLGIEQKNLAIKPRPGRACLCPRQRHTLPLGRLRPQRAFTNPDRAADWKVQRNLTGPDEYISVDY